MTFKTVIHPFKNIWQVIGVMFLLNIASSYFFWPQVISSWEFFIQGSIWGTTIWTTQSVGNSAIFKWLDEKLPWRNGILKRAIVNTFAVGVYSASAFALVQSVMFSIYVDDFTFANLWNEIEVSTIMTVKISFIISFVLSVIGFVRAMVSMEIEKEKMHTEMMSYKYESLRNQINPHFLFNSFNVLSELVYEDQKLAVKFIHQLSDLYRYVLDAKDKDLVPLAEELKFIESFTFLLKTRFENRVEFILDLQPKENDYIVPMALQLLIENCIKHNEALSSNPLKIVVKSEGNRLITTNNLQRKKHQEASTKIGLSNLKERYAYFGETEIIVSETENEFSVSIPILKSSK